MTGKFSVYRDKSGRYRFQAKSGTGQTVATGITKRAGGGRPAASAKAEPQAGRADNT